MDLACSDLLLQWRKGILKQNKNKHVKENKERDKKGRRNIVCTYESQLLSRRETWLRVGAGGQRGGTALSNFADLIPTWGPSNWHHPGTVSNGLTVRPKEGFLTLLGKGQGKGQCGAMQYPLT